MNFIVFYRTDSMTKKIKDGRFQITVVIYPCEFRDKGEGLGPETIARLEKLIELDKRYNVCGVILSAGFSPQRHGNINQAESFAEMQRRWILLNTGISERRIFSKIDVWGGVGETVAAIHVIKAEFLPCKNIFAITSNYHIPRIRMAWWWYKPSEWRVCFLGIELPDNIKSPSRLVEALKTAAAFILKILIGRPGLPLQLEKCDNCGKNSFAIKHPRVVPVCFKCSFVKAIKIDPPQVSINLKGDKHIKDWIHRH
jgi:hypothetical protein